MCGSTEDVACCSGVAVKTANSNPHEITLVFSIWFRSAKMLEQNSKSKSEVAHCVSTVRCEEIAVVDCDTEHVFMKVSDSELHRCIPLWIECVRNDLCLVLLSTHCYLTVWIALSCYTHSSSL